MFFGLIGSMAGGTTSTRATGMSGGTKFLMVNTAASYSPRYGRSRPHTSRLGSDVSM